MSLISYKKIQEVAEKVANEYKPEKIILFGSYAWGKPHADSDVDLFIIKESKKKQQIERMRELRKKLFQYDLPPLDFLIYTKKEMQKRISRGDFWIEYILSKGKTLYDK